MTIRSNPMTLRRDKYARDAACVEAGIQMEPTMNATIHDHDAGSRRPFGMRPVRSTAPTSAKIVLLSERRRAVTPKPLPAGHSATILLFTGVMRTYLR